MTGTRIALPDWLRAAGVREVLAALPGSRFVGGAVRDTLLGLPVGDLDLAAPYPPEDMLQRLERAGIRTLLTGFAHGTVTALAKGSHIEVTSLRQDVETFGRHAKVAFTEDWEADARRRDFTMNALYLDGDGTLYDPVSGRADCLAGRVRFVGDAGQRIAEDYLRILRFYRFLARFGRGEADADARAACREHLGGLGQLAAERIGVEMLKLLKAADPVPALRMMQEDGVWPALFGAAGQDRARLQRLVAREPAPDSLRRLAALLDELADVAETALRLRLSNRERDRLLALRAAYPTLLDLDQAACRREIWKQGPELFRDRLLLQAAETDAQPDLAEPLAIAETWKPPAFPVTGADAIDFGIEPGPKLGRLLTELQDWWAATDFTANREACLARLREIAV